jgi:hypothetical protein
MGGEVVESLLGELEVGCCCFCCEYLVGGWGWVWEERVERATVRFLLE